MFHQTQQVLGRPLNTQPLAIPRLSALIRMLEMPVFAVLARSAGQIRRMRAGFA